MPGQDFDTPSLEKIRDFYENKWKKLEPTDTRREAFFEWWTIASSSWPESPPPRRLSSARGPVGTSPTSRA
uniref:Uncharacterized protein n=1 Tax=Arundo donax TaxID=35708 RepID=A0A0A9F731_ARUDO